MNSSLRPLCASAPRRPSLHSVKGFSLIELLTVVAIIGVLAAVIMSVLGNVRQSASSSRATAQMRKIGLGMQTYIQDNRGALPTSPTHGNLHTGQGPWFNREDRRLQVLMKSYLESPPATTWSVKGAEMDYDASFAWPGWATNSQPGAPSVVLNTSVKFVSSATRGSPWAGTRPSGGQPYVGRRMVDMENPVNERVFIEVDQQNSTAGWANLLPEKPVHGSHRNALYFDWHVAKVPVAN